jgi:uncharacterized protein involved in outer membrane biogenesis
MSVQLKRLLIVVAGLGLLGVAFLWSLPEIVRQVALDQIPKHTGRAVAIGDVDLNLFTGHVAVKDFRLAEREASEAFVEFARFDLGLSLWNLLRSHVRLKEIALAAPAIRIVRTGPAEFNFSDLLAGPKEPAPEPATPSRWTVTVDRLHVERGLVLVDDRAVAPRAEWVVQDLGVDVADITTRPGAAPGRAALNAKINEAVLALSAEPLRLEPLQVTGKLSFEGFEHRRLEPYVYRPLRTPYRPKGQFGLALAAEVDSDAEGVTKAVLAGDVHVKNEALTQVGKPNPFLSLARLGVEIKEVDLLHRSLTVASVAIEGLDLEARRDAQGVIDLIEMFKPPAKPASAARAPAAGPAPSAGAPPTPPKRKIFPVIQALAQGFEHIKVERITLTPAVARFTDEAVKPTTTLALGKLQVRVDDLTWPVKGPARVAFSTGMPGGGDLNIKGSVVLQPLDAELAVALRDAPVEPYQAYIPVPARLSGRLNEDTSHRITLRDGELVATAKGRNWIRNIAISEPGAKQPAIRVERVELAGIDFEWPKRAVVAKTTIVRPRVEIERDAEGAINVRRLFTPTEEARKPADEAKPAPEPAKTAAEPAGPKRKGPMDTLRLDFGESRIEDGAVRFLDRTTKPAFSQDVSRLGVSLKNFGNRPDRRASLVMQSVVGGDGALDVRGEIGPLGSPAFIDLVGELSSFKLPSVDPYAVSNTGWVIKKGELQYKVRFKLDGDQLTAHNDVVVGALQVAPAGATDEVKQRLGLPLDLIVALVKDQQGDIKANVPVTGSVKDPSFHVGDAVWTAIKNVLVNIATAPFKAIGSLLAKGETLEQPRVDPVTFAAGSSVVSPAMEEHLLRVADFLRRTPFVDLTVTAKPSRADLEALKDQAVTARIREFQKERGLKEDAAALAQYYEEHLPGVSLPPTVEEQLALLREREPAPEALVTELSRRRLDATRERLLTGEGIPAARLIVDEAAPAAPADAGGEGRVEFGIAARG